MVKKLVNDVEIVAHYLHQAEEYLELRSEGTSDNGEIEISLENNVEDVRSTDRVLKKGLEIDDDSGKAITEEKVIDIVAKALPGESVIGHMLPLSCGAGGMLSLSELNAYQKHLVKAEIVELAESP